MHPDADPGLGLVPWFRSWLRPPIASCVILGKSHPTLLSLHVSGFGIARTHTCGNSPPNTSYSGLIPAYFSCHFLLEALLDLPRQSQCLPSGHILQSPPLPVSLPPRRDSLRAGAAVSLEPTAGGHADRAPSHRPRSVPRGAERKRGWQAAEPCGRGWRSICCSCSLRRVARGAAFGLAAPPGLRDPRFLPRLQEATSCLAELGCRPSMKGAPLPEAALPPSTLFPASVLRERGRHWK